MSDRELLESAAKAAGIRYTIEDDAYYKTHKFFGLWLVYDDEPSQYARRYWNPLTDDCDALRLAVKCGITDLSMAVGELVLAENCQLTGVAIVRRAIVRAAAEIGKAMP